MPLEIEIKLKVDSHEPVRAALRQAGGVFIRTVLETNMFFDRPDRMAATSVYLLEPYRSDGKYARFMRSNPRTFPDFYPGGIMGSKAWKPPRLIAHWKPPTLIGDVWPENDYPCENAPARNTPIFSPRAVEGLREFLEPNGELLPVRTPLGTYYAYNVTRVVPALAARKALEMKCLMFANQIEKFVFKATLLKRTPLFKVPQLPLAIFVTESFVRRVEELGLNGMWITKVWPMPRGQMWRDSWNLELERTRSGPGEALEDKPVLASPAAKAVRAPTILDLRKDVKSLQILLKRVMRWIEAQQLEWSDKGQCVSAIGLETIGWDMNNGPLVMCHVDTRHIHETDGRWSIHQVASLHLPAWSSFARAMADSDKKRVLIDARGRRHSLEGEDDRLDKWYGEAMAASMKEAKEQGVFKHLRKSARCVLAVEDTGSGLGWRGKL